MTTVDPTRKHIIYCDVCKLPPEYCEFGPSLERCKAWFKDTHLAEYRILYNEPDLVQVQEVVVNAAEEVEQDNKPAKKQKPTAVIIKRSDRNKRKSITTVCQLQAYGVDLKKAAKMFANKFACGASVVKNVQKKQDEIVIQGDVADDVAIFIAETWKVDEELIEITDEKKSKK